LTKRRFFDFKTFAISINLIENLGDFLIVEGQKLTSEIITKQSNIQNPEYLPVSLDELKCR